MRKTIQEVTLVYSVVLMIACLSAVRSVKESTASSVRTCFSAGVMVVAIVIFVKTVKKHHSNALTIIAKTSVAVTAI